ncbi:hypothetical protein PPYR_07973 [Photinus pyralis]|nr:hypothetical protein PPYR_07973 [Photinus pyralis]
MSETARLLKNVRSVFFRKSHTRVDMEVELARKYFYSLHLLTASHTECTNANVYRNLSRVTFVNTQNWLTLVNRGKYALRCLKRECLILLDGFAFSQEEGGTVSQADVIRAYNTNIPKPDGM